MSALRWLLRRIARTVRRLDRTAARQRSETHTVGALALLRPESHAEFVLRLRAVAEEQALEGSIARHLAGRERAQRRRTP